MTSDSYPDPDYIPRYAWLDPREGDVPLHDEVANVHLQSPHDHVSPEISSRDTLSDVDYRSSNPSSSHEEVESDLSAIDEEGSVSLMSRQQVTKTLSRQIRTPRSGRQRGRSGGKGRVPKGTKRGLVKPLEPDFDFKQALALANEAFIGRRLQEAQERALEAIRLNPEIFQAHILLSEIHAEVGDEELSVRALFNGAHTRSRDVQIWFTVKERLSQITGAASSARSAEGVLYCLNRILALQPENVGCRIERIALNKKLGFYFRASQEIEHLLQENPSDLALLRQFAEVSMKTGEVDAALDFYEKAVTLHLTTENVISESFGWSDVNVFVELYAANHRYNTAIEKLKYLSRYLMGRACDDLWSCLEDDREWDLDDQPRRSATPGFEPGLFSRESYGEGLPLELRVKLGAFRLKMGPTKKQESLLHFEMLDPEDITGDGKVQDYPDLFRDVADVLFSHNLHTEALRYYKPLYLVDGFVDAVVLDNMAVCYKYLNLRREAEECYLKMIKTGQRTQVARVQLMSMAEEDGSTQRTQSLIKAAAKDTGTETIHSESAQSLLETDAELLAEGYGILKPTVRREYTDRQALRLKEIQQLEYDEMMHRKFIHLQDLTDGARAALSDSRTIWLKLADELIQDFSRHKPFYPADKFYMSSILAERGQASQLAPSVLGKEVPELYRGIDYASWLDVILEASIFQAQRGYFEKAYETVAIAMDAVVFAVSAPSLLLIHVSWFTCAILAEDHEAMCNICRWFMREYQFVSDGYRLFGALNRACAYDNSWYNSPPSQKHVLRQLKAMDNICRAGTGHQQTSDESKDRGTRGMEGDLINDGHFNVALLILYGHVLYAGKSYTEALNYYFRAYSMQTGNAVLNFSIGLAYLHHAFKRQSDNRHHLVLQGFSFLQNYYEARHGACSPLLKDEANFNIGRAYHTIGLSHLAIPYYERCLSDQHQESVGVASRHFQGEAAMALQNIWAASGNVQKARMVTDRWLNL